jgi:hypothetical protein
MTIVYALGANLDELQVAWWKARQGGLLDDDEEKSNINVPLRHTILELRHRWLRLLLLEFPLILSLEKTDPCDYSISAMRIGAQKGGR